jgi:hypothetical protein
LLVGVLELLKDTRPAKLSFAGVAGFEGAFKGLAEPAPAPDGCADRAARGVEWPESCGAGLWRKGGNAAGVLADGLVGCDQSRPLRSSMVAVGVWYAQGLVLCNHIMMASLMVGAGNLVAGLGCALRGDTYRLAGSGRHVMPYVIA